jgi:hypothetical protein
MVLKQGFETYLDSEPDGLFATTLDAFHHIFEDRSHDHDVFTMANTIPPGEIIREEDITIVPLPLDIDIRDTTLDAVIDETPCNNETLTPLIGEPYDNIHEHSNATTAYLVILHDPLTIIHVDDGITIPHSYERHTMLSSIQDVVALKQAIEGESSIRDEAHGLNTCFDIAVHQKRGEFLLHSRKAAHVTDQERSVLYRLKNHHFPGTVVATTFTP